MIFDDAPITYLTKKNLRRSKNGNDLIYPLDGIEIPLRVYAGVECITIELARLSLKTTLSELKIEAHIYQYGHEMLNVTEIRKDYSLYQASVVLGVVKTLTFDLCSIQPCRL